MPKNGAGKAAERRKPPQDEYLWKVVFAPDGPDGRRQPDLYVRAGYCAVSDHGQVTIGFSGRTYPAVFASGQVAYAVRTDCIEDAPVRTEGPFADLTLTICEEMGIDPLKRMTAEQHAEFSRRFQAGLADSRDALTLEELQAKYPPSDPVAYAEARARAEAQMDAEEAAYNIEGDPAPAVTPESAASAARSLRERTKAAR